MVFDDLLQRVAPYYTEEQLNKLKYAYDYAYEAHIDQFRADGAPYITHPLAIAFILADKLEMDYETIIAALLHDVVEDTYVTMQEVLEHFGPGVALLVDGVTKLTRIKEKTKTEQQAHNLHKMFLAMAKDIRVVIIKLADRLHNMRTLKYLTPEQQQRIATETLEIYAPLANRLGISYIKSELEDISFRFLLPEAYHEIKLQVDKKRSVREQMIKETIADLQKKLQEVQIQAEIKGRPKHFYSIYKKMKAKNRSFSEIYDLAAVRIIVENVKDCYGALGVVHTMWTPIPGRFKDYIAMPKPNMYQSLHTSVFRTRGEPIEIQIRTMEMHITAEYGIAAHWKYKEGINKHIDIEEKLAWLRQVIEFQQELRDEEEFIDSLKVDLFSDQVFIFTPKGDVINLPSEATPIDFAYRIHTEIGNRCIGAKVNGHIVPLDYNLKTGDIVSILTSKSANGPSRDWLNIVKTSTARSRIRQWFKREQREENIERGQEMLNREFKKANYKLKDVISLKTYDLINELIEEMNYNSFDDLLAAIGFGTESALGVSRKLIERYREIVEPEEVIATLMKEEQLDHKRVVKGISMGGIDNTLLKLARCCNPIPGDAVIGYITRGNGVSIHRVTCPNMIARQGESERFIEVNWQNTSHTAYPVQLQITVRDRPGAIYDILGIISGKSINIASLHSKGGIIYMTVEVQHKNELEEVMRKIDMIKDVDSVRRL